MITGVKDDTTLCAQDGSHHDQVIHVGFPHPVPGEVVEALRPAANGGRGGMGLSWGKV